MNAKQKKQKAIIDILKTKKQMKALEAEYNRLEQFLIDNMSVDEEVQLSLGKVKRIETPRRYLDTIALSRAIPFESFLDCVTASVTKAEEYLSGREIEELSETKTFDNLAVTLKKISA